MAAVGIDGNKSGGNGERGMSSWPGHRLGNDDRLFLGRIHAPAEFSSELGLTAREGEVLSWLSKGKTNRDIAQILGLSPRTVGRASRADLLKARRREPHRRGRDRGQDQTSEAVSWAAA